MSKNIAVTGSTGFLGGLVAESLYHRGLNVYHVNRDKEKTEKAFGKDVLFFDSAYSPTELAKKFSEHEIHTVVHTATHFTRSESIEVVPEVLSANFIMPVKVFEAAKSSGARFINFNSFWQEEKNTKGLAPYAASKEAFRRYVDIAAPTTMTVENIYIPETFGPNDPRDKIIANLVRHTIKGDHYKVKNPETKINLTYAPLLAQFVADLVEYKISVSGSVEFVNFHDIRLEEIQETIRDLAPLTAIETTDPTPPWVVETTSSSKRQIGLQLIGRQNTTSLKRLLWTTLQESAAPKTGPRPGQ
jgi:nucleoside-diphosphate-sugar epimerase